MVCASLRTSAAFNAHNRPPTDLCATLRDLLQVRTVHEPGAGATSLRFDHPVPLRRQRIRLSVHKRIQACARRLMRHVHATLDDACRPFVIKVRRAHCILLVVLMSHVEHSGNVFLLFEILYVPVLTLTLSCRR